MPTRPSSVSTSPKCQFWRSRRIFDSDVEHQQRVERLFGEMLATHPPRPGSLPRDKPLRTIAQASLAPT